MPFYVALMLGQKAQCETYPRVLLSVSQGEISDDLTSRIT